MAQDTDGKPPRRDGNREGGRGGERRKDDRGEGRRDDRKGGGGGQGHRRGKGGKGGKGGPHRKEGPKKAPPATYETLTQLTRGPDYRIDKFVLAEKVTHKAVKTEYRLTREGMEGVRTFARLFEAQAAATEPLPEPPPAEPEVAEAPATGETSEDHGSGEQPAPATEDTAPETQEG
ncbi:MAG TPA: hypothetical protein VKZ79_20795 [Alphaproteobacteria bacterium]|nr:hypothetical protein [Alphaproteobacteria bacterium]